jgi:hypothetical protein
MIKAIETIYNGYRFRSRLEARWAVFFDTLGIKYEYEKEGFDLGKAGWYLPDFWLPEYDSWIEIKGDKPTEEEQLKIASLTYSNKKHLGIILTKIPEHGKHSEGYVWWNKKHVGYLDLLECHECKAIGMRVSGGIGITYPTFGGLDCFTAHRMQCSPSCWMQTYGYTECNSPRLLDAYTAARQARFEHGENGR